MPHLSLLWASIFRLKECGHLINILNSKIGKTGKANNGSHHSNTKGDDHSSFTLQENSNAHKEAEVHKEQQKNSVKQDVVY
jgi:hypothetical protein